MSSSILLKGGMILTHDETGHVVPRTADLLIQGSVIADINESLSSSGATVLDCSGKIISPGFIDTHHHVWQTQLRGTHPDETLLEYLYTGSRSNRLEMTEAKANADRQLHQFVLLSPRRFLGPAGRMP